MENIRVPSVDGVSRALRNCLDLAQITAAWLTDKASSSYCFIMIRWEGKGNISSKNLLNTHLTVGILKVVGFFYFYKILLSLCYRIFNSKWKFYLWYFDRNLSSFLVVYKVIKYLIQNALCTENTPIKWLSLTSLKWVLVSHGAPCLLKGALALNLLFCCIIQTGNANIYQWAET